MAAISLLADCVIQGSIFIREKRGGIATTKERDEHGRFEPCAQSFAHGEGKSHRSSEILAEVLGISPRKVERARPNYVPDDTILQRRELTRFRWDLVDQISDLKRRRLTVVDRVFPEFAGHFTDPFGASARELLDRAAATAELLATLDQQLLRLVTLR